MENQNINVETVQAEEIEVLPRKDAKSGEGVTASAGGIGVKADDVNANVTIGTGDISKSDHTLEGATVEGSVNIDNSKTINKGCLPSRFASAANMQVPTAPEAESQGMSK